MAEREERILAQRKLLRNDSAARTLIAETMRQREVANKEICELEEQDVNNNLTAEDDSLDPTMDSTV